MLLLWFTRKIGSAYAAQALKHRESTGCAALGALIVTASSASRGPRTVRTAPEETPASSAVYTWASDVGLGAPAVVGPRRLPSQPASLRGQIVHARPSEHEAFCGTTPQQHACLFKVDRLLPTGATHFVSYAAVFASDDKGLGDEYVIFLIQAASFPSALTDIPGITTVVPPWIL